MVIVIYSGFTHWKWWFIVDLSIETLWIYLTLMETWIIEMEMDNWNGKKKHINNGSKWAISCGNVVFITLPIENGDVP